MLAAALVIALIVATNVVHIETGTQKEVNEEYSRLEIPSGDIVGPQISVEPLDDNLVVYAGTTVTVTARDPSGVSLLDVNVPGLVSARVSGGLRDPFIHIYR